MRVYVVTRGTYGDTVGVYRSVEKAMQANPLPRKPDKDLNEGPGWYLELSGCYNNTLTGEDAMYIQEFYLR